MDPSAATGLTRHVLFAEVPPSGDRALASMELGVTFPHRVLDFGVLLGTGPHAHVEKIEARRK